MIIPVLMKPISITTTVLSLILFNSFFMAPLSLAEVKTTVENTKPQVIPQNGVRIKFMQINLKNTGPDSEVIKSLSFKRTGLSTADDIGRIWLETDDYKRSFAKTLSNDDTVKLNFRNPITLENNETVSFGLLVNLNAQDSTGLTVGFDLMNLETKNNTQDVQIKIKETLKEDDTSTTETTQDKSNFTPKYQYPDYSTTSQDLYDTKKHRVVCKNSLCRLVEKSD